MTREEQTDWVCRLKADLNNGVIFTPWNKEFTEALTDILEQQFCEDAISRQYLLDNCVVDKVTMPYVPIRRIQEAPPVTPQPKIGQYEKHIDHTDCIWYGSDSGCPVTCSQYRDGWNDAMEYIFKNGKGYQPYRHTGSVEMRISQATDFLAEARACAESE